MRRLGGQIPIVPAGLAYQAGERWRVTVRFGPPVYLRESADLATFVQQVESQVRALSDLPALVRAT